MATHGKHTPGPWKVGAGEEERSGRMFATVVAGPYCVARTARNWLPDCPADANARLIAAAPDLLEALKECLERLENTRDGSGPLATQVRAAIAKATGGES